MRGRARTITAEERGFTLPELLLATVLGLLVIGAAVTAFTSAIQSQPRINSQAAAIQQARTMMERITRELRQGSSVPSASASQLSIVTYVHSATCGGAASTSSISCRVTYSCSARGLQSHRGQAGRELARARGPSRHRPVEHQRLQLHAPHLDGAGLRGRDPGIPRQGWDRRDHPHATGRRFETPAPARDGRRPRGLRCRPTPARDGGFTVVEVLIAAVLLAITAIAVFGLVDAASRNNYRSQQSQVENDRLQQEMEKLKQVPYDQLALTSLPAHSSASNDPNSRVSGTTFNVSPEREQLRGPRLQRRQLAGVRRHGERRDGRPRTDVVSGRRCQGQRLPLRDLGARRCLRQLRPGLVQARGGRRGARPDGERQHAGLPGASGEPLQPQRRAQQVPRWVERLHQPGRPGPDPVDVLAHRHAVQLQRAASRSPATTRATTPWVSARPG